MQFKVVSGPGEQASSSNAGYDPVVGAWSGSGPPHLLPTALPTTDGTADIVWPEPGAVLAASAQAGSNAPQSIYAGPSHVGGLAGTKEGAEIDALVAAGRGDETQGVLAGDKSTGGVYTLAGPSGTFTVQSAEELEVGATYEVSFKRVAGPKSDKTGKTETAQSVPVTTGRTPAEPKSASGSIDAQSKPK